jgi:hypothetical protein
MYHVERLIDAPIIAAPMHPSIGHNIQGPSLIRIPDWVSDPLGRYYLYFADHKGSYIRLAYADDLRGPWTVHEPGALHLRDSCFPTEDLALEDETYEKIRVAIEARLGDQMPSEMRDDLVVAHIASPDVHVDDERQEIVMYFHGLETVGNQVTRRATSSDGLRFAAQPEVLGPSYFRSFRYGGWWYCLAMPGRFLRSRDGRTAFESGPTLFCPSMRHSAVRIIGDTLEVFWTRVGDTPERIFRSTVEVSGDWNTWRESEPVEVLRPERAWEGADEPLTPSRRGALASAANQLRDPCVFDEEGRLFLLYSVAGESGIGIAELSGSP